MIVFKDDWDLYPNAIPDLKTSNKSFLRYSALLRDMGVKNYLFPLQLHNPDLQGVDPRSPDLTLRQKEDIALECKDNFYYYIREVACSPDSTPELRMPFIANRGNMALYWLYFNHITNIQIQPRQTGKSYSTDELMCFLMDLGVSDYKIMLLTKDEKTLTSNLARVKKLLQGFPSYIRMLRPQDIANTEEICIKSNGNRYVGFLPNKSPKAALNVGRGHTSATIQIDEAAFFYNIGITLPSVLMVTTAAFRTSEYLDTPRGIILTTTAGLLNDPDGEYVFKMLQESAVWTEKFLDCYDEKDLYSLVRANGSNNLRVNSTFSYKQLGYTDQWAKEVLERTNSKGEAADRDMFNIWTTGSGAGSPFDKDTSRTISLSIKNDFYNEITKPFAYIVRWFIPENRIDEYMSREDTVAGIDTSEAIGKDDIFMVVRSVSTGEVIAAGDFNETFIPKFGMWLCSFMMRFKRLTLIMERKSTGASIMDQLCMLLCEKGENPFTRMYNTIVHKSKDSEVDKNRFLEVTKESKFRIQEKAEKYKKSFGFTTSASGETSRTELFSTTLNAMAKLTANTVNDPKLINQLLGLTVVNNRIDHKAGCHDDGVIAWLLSGWLMISGKNLSYYGITSGSVLKHNQIKNKDEDAETAKIMSEQRELKNLIADLVDQIKKEKDENIIYRLTHRLKSMYSNLTAANQASVSFDELIYNINLNKKNNRYSNMYR